MDTLFIRPQTISWTVQSASLVHYAPRKIRLRNGFDNVVRFFFFHDISFVVLARNDTMCIRPHRGLSSAL